MPGTRRKSSRNTPTQRLKRLAAQVATSRRGQHVWAYIRQGTGVGGQVLCLWRIRNQDQPTPLPRDTFRGYGPDFTMAGADLVSWFRHSEVGKRCQHQLHPEIRAQGYRSHRRTPPGGAVLQDVQAPTPWDGIRAEYRQELLSAYGPRPLTQDGGLPGAPSSHPSN